MEKQVFNKIYELQTGEWWFGNARNKLVITLLKDLFKDLKKKKVLDAGCSEGAFLEYLKNEKLDFMAIDVDKNAINFCKKRGFEKNVRYGSILDIPFKENSFDIVTSLDVVEHVDDDKQAIGELKRVCKKKGIVFLIVPAHMWLWSSNDVAYHHYRRYDIKRLRSLAKLHKMDVIAISYFNILLFPVFVFVTILTKLFPNEKSSSVLKPLPKPINNVLTWIMGLELGLIRKNVSKKRLGFWGSSYVVVLKKRD